MPSSERGGKEYSTYIIAKTPPLDDACALFNILVFTLGGRNEIAVREKHKRKDFYIILIIY